MNISPATLSDIPQLCDLLELLFSEEAEFYPNRALQSAGLHQIIENPDGGQILVLAAKDPFSFGMVNLLFTISTALGGRVAILEDMVIQAAQRGSGAGSRLLQAAINVARSAECRRITLLPTAPTSRPRGSTTSWFYLIRNDSNAVGIKRLVEVQFAEPILCSLESFRLLIASQILPWILCVTFC